MANQASLGIIGLGTMGSNLALNIADKCGRVAVWNLEQDLTDRLVAENPGTDILASSSLADFVQTLERPRRMMMMITAGRPVDLVIESLIPLLDEGDIVIDGGNSWFRDTQRRELELRQHGIRFFGVGVSGGSDGARFGPALMPGGDAQAYAHLAPTFEAIAARTESGPCVAHVGPDGAGHFVKTVHNGIEYADMQMIAEVYDVMRRHLALGPDELAATFEEWNNGPLESFLIEITGQILRVRDPRNQRPLVDQVLDRAGQKGTGRWTVQVALELGIPVPAISAALDARALSSFKAERVELAGQFGEMSPGTAPAIDIARVHDALYAAKICAYAQGLRLIQAASDEFDWSVDLRDVARIWKGGCIIRARFLNEIMQAYERQPDLPGLFHAETFRKQLAKHHGALRDVVASAQQAGIPVPALASCVAYLDSYRTARLPQNLTQAQRDAFGAHTYQRVDDADGPAVHTDWLHADG
ncbi:MAG: 6-phosphogluconate dehydrogenase [Chlamydiales bacterium]|jgi:6-phosphogluconate dehydrogenase